MKKNYLLFSLLLLIATSHAQVLSFSIKGKTNTSLPYLVLHRQSNNGIISIQDTLKIAADKTFSQTIKINKPTKASLTCGDKMYRLWLTPGHSLTIHLKNENVTFSGNAGIFANYYMEDDAFWSKIFKSYQKRNPNFDKGEAVNSDKYYSIQDSITNQRLDFLKKYFIHSSIKERQAFIKEESMSFIYSNLYYKASNVEKFKFYQDKQKMSSLNFYGFSDRVKFNNQEALSNDYFRQFTISFIISLITQRRNENGLKFVFDSFLDSAMTTIDELIEDNKVAEEVKICFINYIVEEMERNKNSEWNEKIYAALPTLKSQNIPFVKEKLDKLRMDTRFNKGNSAPDFTLTDLSGKNYSLNDFKGKKIYIDLGASWCGHCIENIPSWNKLVEENEKNNDVLFIAISLDHTEEKWRTYTEKYHIKGLQLYAGKGGFESSFAISYKIKSLPQYMLIDKEGKFNKFSAPSPYSEEIKEELLQR